MRRQSIVMHDTRAAWNQFSLLLPKISSNWSWLMRHPWFFASFSNLFLLHSLLDLVNSLRDSGRVDYCERLTKSRVSNFSFIPVLLNLLPHFCYCKLLHCLWTTELHSFHHVCDHFQGSISIRAEVLIQWVLSEQFECIVTSVTSCHAALIQIIASSNVIETSVIIMFLSASISCMMCLIICRR